jgi:CrcB protein
MIPRMHHLGHVVLLAVAGAAGTLLRAGCTTLADRLLGQAFPWGTLAVNVAGSFAFGAINALARSRGLLTNPQEVILLVGLFGGFTTYSSFAFQSVEMLAHGRVAAALAYVAATNVAALAAVWAGLRIFGSA